MKTVNHWKKAILRQAEIEYKVKADKIRLVPENSKRGIEATWKNIDTTYCPINKKFYHVYWVRTPAEFKQNTNLPK